MIAKYVLPLLLFFLFLYGVIKKVRLYDAFLEGAKNAFELSLTLFPYLAAILIAVALFRASGGIALLNTLTSPIFHFLGIPKEITELVLLRPFSGSGSLALLEEILKTYGPDSYIARCATVFAGGGDTVFYLAAVYFSSVGIKRLHLAIPIALFSMLFGTVLACLLCRVL